MEEAAWLVLGAGLRGEPSDVDPRLRTWAPEVATELHRRIENDPDPEAGGFLDKLREQLRGASDEVIVLAAELLYLQSAPLSNVTSPTKLSQVATVLSWCAEPRVLPEALAAGLREPGAFNGGMTFLIHKWKHLLWLCRFVTTWHQAAPDAREAALRDPWRFREITLAVPKDISPVRYELEFLAWPGVFPPTVSIEHRNALLDGMADDIGGRTGTTEEAATRDLVALRQVHTEQEGGGFPKWYSPPYVARWKGVKAGQRAWLIRPGEGGSRLVAAWQRDGFVSLKAEMLGELAPGSNAKAVGAAVRAGYAHLDLTQQRDLTTAYHSFLSVLNPDDVVATVDRDRLLVGVVAGEPEYVDERGARLRREVAWSTTTHTTADLPDPIPTHLEQQGSVVDLTAVYHLLKKLPEAPPNGEPGGGGTEVPPEEVVPSFPPVSADLARSLHMDAGSLQQIADLLHSRRQLVLYGPPGTGKTYIAKHLARHLTGDPSRVRLVQFHPSYAYEDFFEGYRPALTESGQPSFELRAGPLREIAAEAANPDNRQNVYVLIIDEMNRANLAKVFGELYFLLEYRKDTVRLQYSPEQAFRLPLNLFIIGTMNTADRSIALVDAAIRRRFPFYEMHPGKPPVAGVLEKYVKARAASADTSTAGDERVGLLRALNEAIGAAGHDLHIGPSYFMREELDEPGRLEQVWQYDILPLLEEHFYGQKTRAEIARVFGLASVRKRAQASAEPSLNPELPDTISAEGDGSTFDAGAERTSP